MTRHAEEIRHSYRGAEKVTRMVEDKKYIMKTD